MVAAGTDELHHFVLRCKLLVFVEPGDFVQSNHSAHLVLKDQVLSFDFKKALGFKSIFVQAPGCNKTFFEVTRIEKVLEAVGSFLF